MICSASARVSAYSPCPYSMAEAAQSVCGFFISLIPLQEPIAAEDISIREEFIQNKYVITLSGYSENVPNRMELVSDSTIMDAVGVYRQNEDVVVEVYCRDLYDYDLTMGNGSLTVDFKEIGDSYAASAVRCVLL